MFDAFFYIGNVLVFEVPDNVLDSLLIILQRCTMWMHPSLFVNIVMFPPRFVNLSPNDIHDIYTFVRIDGSSTNIKKSSTTFN